MIILIIAILLILVFALSLCSVAKDSDAADAKYREIDWTPLCKMTKEEAGETELPQEVADWLDMEEACEGKTVRTLSCNEVGIIIRFTDGSSFTHLNGIAEYKERV